MSDTKAKGRGSNTPAGPQPMTDAQIDAWLEFELDALNKRRLDVLESLMELDAAFPVVASENDQGVLAEAYRMANAVRRTSDTRRKELKQPFLDGGRRVDKYFATAIGALDQPMDSLNRKMTAYANKLIAERRKALELEQERLRQIELERHAEAQRAMQDQQAAQQIEALDRAAAASADAERAFQAAAAPTRDLARVRGDMGANATIREFIDVQIADVDAIPRYLLVPDMIKARSEARALWNDVTQRDAIRAGTLGIPGFRLVVTRETQVR